MQITDVERAQAVAQQQQTILQAEMRSLAQEMGDAAAFNLVNEEETAINDLTKKGQPIGKYTIQVLALAMHAMVNEAIAECSDIDITATVVPDGPAN
jgi:hypothetical protein